MAIANTAPTHIELLERIKIIKKIIKKERDEEQLRAWNAQLKQLIKVTTHNE